MNLSNQRYEPYFKGTNFGSLDYQQIIYEGMMKIACGYHIGSTLTHILIELGYAKRVEDYLELTDDGKFSLYNIYTISLIEKMKHEKN